MDNVDVKTLLSKYFKVYVDRHDIPISSSMEMLAYEMAYYNEKRDTIKVWGIVQVIDKSKAGVNLVSCPTVRYWGRLSRSYTMYKVDASGRVLCALDYFRHWSHNVHNHRSIVGYMARSSVTSLYENKRAKGYNRVILDLNSDSDVSSGHVIGETRYPLTVPPIILDPNVFIENKTVLERAFYDKEN